MGDKPWSDFRDDPPAEWMLDIWMPVDWKMNTVPNNALLRLSFVSILTLQPDWMHLKYLGTDKYFYGSVLALMVFYLLPGLPNTRTPGQCPHMR